MARLNSIQHMPVRVIEHPYILELKYTALHPNFIQMLLPNLTPPQPGHFKICAQPQPIGLAIERTLTWTPYSTPS